MLAMAKRVLLFVVVNILVITTMTITWSIISKFLGIEQSGMGYLLGFCLTFGMGGAFISLWMSKFMAKWMMRVQVIDPRTNDPGLRQLVDTVHNLARGAQLKKMPEVGIYESPEVNAFATGPSKNNSLVAVSTGLLQRMGKDEVEGVLGHEVAHIANGDMVTMTLIQGIINALVMFVARIIASLVASQMDERARPAVQFGLIIVLQIVLSILGSVVVNYFSRHREFRADAGGARLAGRDKMTAALRALMGTTDSVDTEHEALASLKISGSTKSALAKLFSTHPPLEERIRRLESTRI